MEIKKNEEEYFILCSTLGYINNLDKNNLILSYKQSKSFFNY